MDVDGMYAVEQIWGLQDHLIVVHHVYGLCLFKLGSEEQNSEIFCSHVIKEVQMFVNVDKMNLSTST